MPLARQLEHQWIVHPRTVKSIQRFGVMKKLKKMKNLHLTQPYGYFENLSLMSGAKGVLTDSGGMQEESTYLKVPCLTLRPTTERPITVSYGTSEIVGNNKKLILACVDKILANKWKKGRIPPLWDVKTP